MDDYRDKIEASESGFLKFLTKIIPGYGGYRDKELRREADRLLREAVLSRLKEGQKLIEGMRGLFNPITQGTDLLALEKLVTKIETLIDRLRYAKYGYTGAFAAVKIDAEKLDQLYLYDETLVKKAEAITEAAKGASGSATENAGKIKAALDEFEDALNKRERLLMEE